LKATKTNIKDNTNVGKILEKTTSNNESGFLENLKNKFDTLRPMITGDDSELEDVKANDL
jgi:hypothetical protein